MNDIHNKLPIFEAVITDENSGVFCVSLVSNPATQIDFVCFDEDKPIMKFAVEDAKERLVSGVIMLADTPIYRRNGDYEYYIRYSKDTLKIMAEKMIFDGVGSSVNIQHKDNSNVEGVNLVELFVIDREKGISPTYFEAVPDGSLIGTYKVHNEDVWNMIEKGEVLSFSLEGYFQVIETQETFNKTDKETFNMKLTTLKTLLRSILVEMNEVSTDKGILVWNGEEELAVGDAVKGLNEEGTEVDLEDGDYVTEDGKTIVVKEGKVEEIKEKEEAPVAEEEKPIEEEPKPIEGEEKPIEEEEKPIDEPQEDEKDLKIKELEDALAAKDAEIEELKAKIAELENEPAAKDAAQEFANAKEVVDNTPKGKMAKRGYKF